MKKNIAVYFVIGFALFSMLFGSGNLIFPPEIGITGGEHWGQGFIAYFLADAVLGICSVFAMMKVGGDVDRLTGTVGRTGSVIINTAVIACIGPLLAIPRNAAVTFEMGIAPLLGIDPQSRIVRLVFSLVFFGVVILLTVRPSKVIEILGKYLTPILVIAIAVLIIRGIIAPAGTAGPAVSVSLIKDGIYNGYQTLDLMAAIFFAIIVIDGIRNLHLPSARDEHRTVIFASVIAGAILCFVYGGMAYLGASTGSLWTEEFMSGEINQAGLVVSITNALLGNLGVVVLSVIVSLACLTTAIGLTSSAAAYFSRLLLGPEHSETGRKGDRECTDAGGKGGRRRLSGYEGMVIFMCAVSTVLCNFGLSAIISFAAPVLMLFYPTVMFLTLTTLVRERLRKKYFYWLGAGMCFLISAITVLADTFGIPALSFIHTALPLDSFGFNWVVPTVIAAVVGLLIPGPEIDGSLLGSEE